MIPIARPVTVDEALTLLRNNLTDKEKETIKETGSVFAYISLGNCFGLYGENDALMSDWIKRDESAAPSGSPGEDAAGYILKLLQKELLQQEGRP